MYGIPDRLKPLSAAEEQVLLALWDCKPPASRRDIGARLAAKGWAAATVLNFLYRLEEKGWVICTKEQNHNLYSPTVTRRAYGVFTMRQRLDTVFGGDLAQAVRALVSESGCSQSELEQAIAVLNEKHAEAEEYDLYDLRLARSQRSSQCTAIRKVLNLPVWLFGGYYLWIANCAPKTAAAARC